MSRVPRDTVSTRIHPSCLRIQRLIARSLNPHDMRSATPSSYHPKPSSFVHKSFASFVSRPTRRAIFNLLKSCFGCFCIQWLGECVHHSDNAELLVSSLSPVRNLLPLDGLPVVVIVVYHFLLLASCTRPHTVRRLARFACREGGCRSRCV